MKYIIIAPYLASKDLVKQYRIDDPFVDVKFFTKSSFLSNYYYQYGEDALLHVTNKFRKDYDVANQILQAISKMVIEDTSCDKYKELLKIKISLLDEKLLSRNEYFEQELKDSVIDVYFYSENDTELNKYLRGKNVHYISKIGTVPTKVEAFHSNNEELSYVFNEVARLLDNGVSGNKIAIYGLGESDEVIYSRLLKNYKFHINNAYPKTLLSKVYVNRFIANILESGVDEAYQNEVTISSNDETFDTFTKIVKKYHNPSLTNVYQSEIYQSIFNKTKLENVKYDDGIEIVNEPICPKDGYLFIVNMVQGLYPILTKDNGYLSDDDKVRLGIVTSEEENIANYELFINYLKQDGKIYLSYSDCSFSSKYYPSPLIKSLNIEVNIEHDIEKYYSFDEAQFAYANELDIEKNYLSSSKLLQKFRNSKDIDILYRTYTYNPTPIKHFSFNKVVELSYTKTTTYYQCGFKYYLNNILKIDELEDNFSITLGLLTHRIFQNISTGKTFDELYDEAYETYKTKFGKNDWVFLRRIKKDLKRVFDYVISFEMQTANASFKREMRMSTYLTDHVQLTGVLDKVIVFNDTSEVAVVDYKTGKAEFVEPLIEYGMSLQLPTYSLLLKKSDEFSKSKIAGLFLQPLLLPTSETLYSRVADNDLNTFAKLNGLISNRDDDGAIKLFDSSDKPKNSIYLASVGYKIDGSLSLNACKKLRSEEYFDKLADSAEQLIVDAGNAILNNEFPINPKMVDDVDESCKYCPFKDICYKDDSAYVRINTKKVKKEEEETSNELN